MKKLIDRFFSNAFQSSGAYQHIAPLLKDKLNGVESILEVEEEFVYTSSSLCVYHYIDEKEHAHFFEIELPEKLVHYQIALQKYSYIEQFAFITTSDFPLEVENKVLISYNSMDSNYSNQEVAYGESSVEYIDRIGNTVSSYHQTVYTKKGEVKSEQHRNLSQTRLILEALKEHPEYEHNIDQKGEMTRFDKTYLDAILDKVMVTKKDEKQKIKIAPFDTKLPRKF